MLKSKIVMTVPLEIAARAISLFDSRIESIRDHMKAYPHCNRPQWQKTIRTLRREQKILQAAYDAAPFFNGSK